jgi:hypothetical protein
LLSATKLNSPNKGVDKFCGKKNKRGVRLGFNPAVNPSITKKIII